LYNLKINKQLKYIIYIFFIFIILFYIKNHLEGINLAGWVQIDMILYKNFLFSALKGLLIILSLLVSRFMIMNIINFKEISLLFKLSYILVYD